MRMKTAPTLASITVAAGAVVGVMMTYWPDSEAGNTANTATTGTCTSTNQTCSATATSTCAGNVPDAGSATGITIENVQSYFLRACPPTGQTFSGAGSVQLFHCYAGDGKCAEVRDNRQSINAPAGPSEGGMCWESATFVVPYIDNTSDTLTAILSGVTTSPGDAGTATISICPQR